MVRVKDILDGFESKVVLKRKEISLVFEGYYNETNLARFDGKIGVYCAYATNADGKLSDLVYIGRSGDNIKNRVLAHQDENDEARSTLKKGEHLAYSFAETNEHELCEEVLIARHRDYPRLANTKLKKPYEGKSVHLTISGKCLMLHTDIQYNGPENGAVKNDKRRHSRLWLCGRSPQSMAGGEQQRCEDICERSAEGV